MSKNRKYITPVSSLDFFFLFCKFQEYKWVPSLTGSLSSKIIRQEHITWNWLWRSIDIDKRIFKKNLTWLGLCMVFSIFSGDIYDTGFSSWQWKEILFGEYNVILLCYFLKIYFQMYFNVKYKHILSECTTNMFASSQCMIFDFCLRLKETLATFEVSFWNFWNHFKLTFKINFIYLFLVALGLGCWACFL